MAPPLKQRILEQIDALPVELQQHVLDFARGLTQPVVKGVPGKSLLVFAGTIPENDIWIAAVTQQNGLTLVTRDVHFGAIEALAVERW